MKKRMGLLCLLVLGTALMAMPKGNKKESDTSLAPGRYTSTIKAFVCSGCAEWVEAKLKVIKSLENVSVDQKTRVLSFTVKKGTNLKRTDIQSVLDAAAREMGMGADYTMEGVSKSKN